MRDFTSIDSSDLAFNNEYIFSDNESNISSENNLNDISDEIMNAIFNYKRELFDEYEYKTKYFIPYIKYSGPKKKKLFIVTDTTNQSTQLIRKKRGTPSALNKKRVNIHGRSSFDNLLIMIKNHSLSSAPPFLNDILKVLFIDEKFLPLAHKFKKNIKKYDFSEVKKKTLGEIICNKISPKFNKYDENRNIITFEKVKDHEVFKKILNMDYITFFKRYYIASKKCINLKDFGLEHEIILSDKCKMYNDLIERIKNSKNNDNEGYIKSIKKCIDKNYTKKLFKTSK